MIRQALRRIQIEASRHAPTRPAFRAERFFLNYRAPRIPITLVRA